MSGLLSLKWNNHSSVFLSLLQSLRIKELYCDTTIVCHGKYYPVHKLVLSTCSDYFEDIFEKTECKHPFIIMRDVEPSQLEALLNYMYKGEVNVLQESLPGLIKTAEALKIKGLAVPDDVSPPKSKSTHREKKRVYNPSFDDHSPKMMRLEKNSEKESHSDHNLVKSSRDNVLDSIASPTEKDTPTSSQFEPNLNANPEAERHTPLNGLPIQVKSEPSEALDESPEIQPKEESSSFNFSTFPNASIESEGVKDSDSDIYGSFPVQNSYQDLNLSWDRGEPSTSNEQDLDEVPRVSNTLNPTLSGSEFSSLGPNSSHCFLSKKKVPGPPEGVHKCLLCNFTTRWKCNLRTHLRRAHTGEKPFRCTYCSYCCCSSDSLRLHIRTHTGEKPYQCPVCPHKTAVQNNLARHIRRKHTGKVCRNKHAHSGI